jgi:hypothetical protein
MRVVPFSLTGLQDDCQHEHVAVIDNDLRWNTIGIKSLVFSVSLCSPEPQAKQNAAEVQ